MGMATPLTTTQRAWIEDADCDLDDFRALVSADTDLADYPFASDVRQGVLVYSADDDGERRSPRSCRPS